MVGDNSSILLPPLRAFLHMDSVYRDDSALDRARLVNLLIAHSDGYVLGKVACNGEKPHEAKVTVLVPCYLKAGWVLETARSALRQSRKPDAIHVLLMDEESRKLRGELEALSPTVSCEEHDRLMLSDARNRLAEGCGTEFMALLDADDLLAPNFFERMLSRDADFTLARSVVTHDGQKMFLEHRSILSGNLTGVFRTEAFLGLGGLDPKFNGILSGDTDFLLTAMESGRTVRICRDTRYFLRRDSGLWEKSSVTRSMLRGRDRDEACRLLLSKHREFWNSVLEYAAESGEGETDTWLDDALSLWRRAT